MKLAVKLLLIMVLPFTILAVKLISRAPNSVEEIYVRRIYPVIASLLNTVNGLLPFSLAEIIVLLFFAAIVGSIINLLVQLIRRPWYRRKLIVNYVLNLFLAISLIYAGFIFLWGLNYHRLPFSTITQLETGDASLEELIALNETLILRANEQRLLVQEDENGVMHLPAGIKDVFRRADKGYEQAGVYFPALAGSYSQPKGILLSPLMAWTGIWGVYFPFTGEANVNTAIPHSMLPNITAHEMAHQRGFAREDEANFIAYLTASMHPDSDFQYSGTLLALMHSMSALARQDRDKYYELRDKYSDGVRRDLHHVNEFSRKHDSIISEISDRINNAYLKANAQRDGVKSYGRMVDLLIAYHRSIPLED
ncbi:MAG: DUF3810 domain-containing protein [Bacillota bacterium]